MWRRGRSCGNCGSAEKKNIYHGNVKKITMVTIETIDESVSD